MAQKGAWKSVFSSPMEILSCYIDRLIPDGYRHIPTVVVYIQITLHSLYSRFPLKARVSLEAWLNT